MLRLARRHAAAATHLVALATLVARHQRAQQADAVDVVAVVELAVSSRMYVRRDMRIDVRLPQLAELEAHVHQAHVGRVQRRIASGVVGGVRLGLAHTALQPLLPVPRGGSDRKRLLWDMHNRAVQQHRQQLAA